MTARTPATLKSRMPVGTPGAIDGPDIHDIVDTLDGRTMASVREFGAKLDGVTDDTAAWNAAVASNRPVYFPEGTSVVTNTVELSGLWGTAIIGSGRETSRFRVNAATFNMAAPAVIRLNAGYQRLHALCIEFVQPSTTVRANLHKYPPAVVANGNGGRVELSNLRIDAAWDGIRGVVEGTGGSYLDDIQVGAFNIGIDWDRALDSVRLNRIHFWPFGISQDANLYAVYSDGNTFAAQFGRVDDLKLDSFISFRGRIRFHGGSNGEGAFGTGSGVALDSDYGRLEFEAGEMSFGQVNGSTGGPGGGNDFLIKQTGGDLRISGMAFEAGALTQPMVRVEGALSVFTASDIRVISLGGSPVFQLAGGTMTLSNGYIKDTSNVSRSAAIHVAGGRATVVGMRASDALGGTRNFIQVDNDDHHAIIGNTFVGWSYATPAAKVFGIYGPNNSPPSRVSSNDLITGTKVRALAGTMDGSGNASITHNVANAHTRVVGVGAFYVTAVGERVAVANVTVAGSVVVVSAAAGANRAVEAWLHYV